MLHMTLKFLHKIFQIQKTRRKKNFLSTVSAEDLKIGLRIIVMYC